MNNIIEVKNVSKVFNHNSVIKNISFSVQKGEIFGFLGPSGAGKTTTLKMITKQLIPTEGEIIVYSDNLNNHIKIGILSDNSSVYERLTIKENLMLFANIHHISHKEVDVLLKQVGLYEDKDKQVKAISKGMKQRLMLACAVIHQPDILFLDEPTSSLDPASKQEIHKLIINLNKKGTTIFLTTHNMHEAEKLCDRIAFLNVGEIVELNTPEGLKQKYGKKRIEVTLYDEEKTYYIDPYSKDKEILIQWINNHKIKTIHSSEPSIEDIFITLTGRGFE